VFHAFTCRSRSRSLIELGPLSNRGLVQATLVAFALQAIAVYGPFEAVFRTTPLDLGELGLALALALTQLVVGELEKVARRAFGADTLE
jgi:Ca2+-transporting ATPase